jgi:O-antigen/teichoic acid export membrane protein
MKNPIDWEERLAAIIDDLPDRMLRRMAKGRHLLSAIGEEAFDLITSLLILVMVERTYGQQGLGIYAYLTACFFAVRYLANYGIDRHVEIETARLGAVPRRNRQIAAGYQAVLYTSAAGALVLMASAGFDTSHTQVHERLGAYVIMALTLGPANVNRLKLAILQGMGRHSRVAQLRFWRHGLILGAMFLLTRAKVPPSYLLVAFLIADIITGFYLRRHIKFPKRMAVFKHPRQVWATLQRGQAHLFTDNAVELLLNIDLFVLGLFVSDYELGVYAEAAVLARLLLIVSQGVKPILRRRYAMLAERGKTVLLKSAVGRSSAILFSLQAAMILIVLLYFPALLDFLFETRSEAVQSFRVFLVFVPGIIFYTVFSAQEPIYEALNRAYDLKKLTLTTVVVNLLLSFYLVPAAGIYGAAVATMTTMLVHFLLFGRHLEIGPDLRKSSLITAGLAFYLVYTLLNNAALSPAVTCWLGPMLLGLGFYGCGIFGVKQDLQRKET